MWLLLRLASGWQASTTCCCTKLLKKESKGGWGWEGRRGGCKQEDECFHNSEILLILPVDQTADYVTKQKIILWITVFLSTLAHYDPMSVFLNTGIRVCQFAILSEKIHQKEGKQASYHHIPLMSRKCQPSSCHNKGTSKSQQKN